MTRQAEQVIDAALKLTEEERAQVAEAILESLHPADSLGMHDAWLAEIERRSSAFDRGEVTGTPWSEVKASARRKLGQG